MGQASVAHFQRFSNALCHLIEFQTNSPPQSITNYLDDFLFIALTLLRCNYLIESFLSLCNEIGVPVSLEKTEWGSARVVFLGILLDGESMTLNVPVEKRDRAIKLLLEFIDRKKTTVKQLQALCGFLNFLGKAIFPGRMFTRRMYAKYSDVVKFNGEAKPCTSKLKQYHHVRLDSEFKRDCEVWLQFLQGDLRSVVCRPMVDILRERNLAKTINFYSDTSAAKTLGFGCLLNSHWAWGTWELGFIERASPSIEFLELYALCVGVLIWERHPEMTNSRVTIHCDNMAVVHMINSMTSSCGRCMHLLHIIALNNLQSN